MSGSPKESTQLDRKVPRTLRFQNIARILFAGLAIAGGLSLLLPAMQSQRSRVRPPCVNNLKQIGLALHNYHDACGSLPPAYLVDQEGNPIHSWRVLILPFLDQQSLYDEYNFDEPWNGPNNRRLLQKMPRVYGCPSDRGYSEGQGTFTSYAAVVGPDTAWPGESVVTFSDFTDGSSNTAIVIEFNHSNIPWLKPSDPKFDAALQLLTADDPATAGEHDSNASRNKNSFGRNVAMADGSIRFFSHGGSKANWSALLSRRDDATWDQDEIQVQPKSLSRPR